MGKRDGHRNNDGGNGNTSKSTSTTTTTSSSSSSIVEKLQMLRSFVGSNSGFSESDLSTCLRQSGFLVELAAERLMTGQFQPSKKVKTKVPEAASSSAASSSYSGVATPCEKSGACVNRTSPLSVHETPYTNPAATRPRSTPSSGNSTNSTTSSSSALASKSLSSSSVLVTPRTSTPVVRSLSPPCWKSTAWLLCQRWVSDATNLTRGGACRYQETFAIADVSADSTILRFRGSQMQGSFPKHLAMVLVPLLHANLIMLEASALMEERNLSIGAHVPFSLS
jgi:hypothetical protein